MKTTQEAITKAKDFNDKWQDLRTIVLPILQFQKEDSDKAQPMVNLVKIPERANAYARSSVRDVVEHVLLATRLVNPGVDLMPIGEFQSSWYYAEEYTKAEKSYSGNG